MLVHFFLFVALLQQLNGEMMNERTNECVRRRRRRILKRWKL